MAWVAIAFASGRMPSIKWEVNIGADITKMIKWQSNCDNEAQHLLLMIPSSDADDTAAFALFFEGVHDLI